MKQRVYYEAATAPGALFNEDEVICEGQVTMHPYHNEIPVPPTHNRPDETTILSGTHGVDCWIVVDDARAGLRLIKFFASGASLTLIVGDQRIPCTLSGSDGTYTRWDLRLRTQS